MNDFIPAIQEAARAMQGIEIAAVFFSLLYVFLAARENIWCWPAAMVSVILYTIICVKADLWAETGLQLFYGVMAVVGYLQWTKKRKASEDDKAPIESWPLKKHVLPLALSAIITLLLGYVLKSYTPAANPLLDSFTTVFSLYATWLVTQKVLENWLYWVVIDAASIALYGSRGLYLTALLFLAYTIIAALGYLKWCRHYLRQEQLQAA